MDLHPIPETDNDSILQDGARRELTAVEGKSRPNLERDEPHFDGEGQELPSEKQGSKRNFLANLKKTGSARWGSQRSLGGTLWSSQKSLKNERPESYSSTRQLWRDVPPSPTKNSSQNESWSDTTEKTEIDEMYDVYRDELDKALLEQIHKDDIGAEGDFNPHSKWTTCWGRFWYEINPCQNWFLVEDPPYTQRTLDIPASFAPTGPCPIAGKFLSLFSGLAVLVWTLLVEENKIFTLAYLSTWNLIFFLIYMVCSLLNTWQGVAQPFSRVSGTVRIAWYMLAVTTHMGILEIILYWGTEVDYDDEDGVDFSFRNFMLHGGLTLEAIMDGFTVNFIPLRWMQWWGCCLLPNIVYLAWTLVHAFFLFVGNPNELDRNTIYKIIDWRFQWKETLKWMLITLFIISPLVFLALWMMSLYKWFCCWCWRRERRHYLQTTGNMEKYREMAAKQVADAIAKAEEKVAREKAKREARKLSRARKGKEEELEGSDEESFSSSKSSDAGDIEKAQRKRFQFFNRKKEDAEDGPKKSRKVSQGLYQKNGKSSLDYKSD